MFEELCAAVGEERLQRIGNLKIYEVDEICHRAKSCGLCPLALHYVDIHNVPRICCMEIATDTRIRKILDYGGYFKSLKGL